MGLVQTTLRITATPISSISSPSKRCRVLFVIDMGSVIPKFTLQRLNANNLSLWCKKIELVLRGHVLWGYFNGAAVSDGTQDSQKKDQDMYMILLSIEAECFAPVVSLRNPKDMYQKLSNLYKATSETIIDAYLLQKK